MSCFIPGNRELDLSFNGPFVSNVRLNSQELLARGYRKTAGEVVTSLGKHRWTTPKRHQRGNDLLYDVDTYEGQTLLPRYFVAYQPGAETSLQELDSELGDRINTLDQNVPGRLTLKNLRIKFHDFGTGVVAVDGTLQTNRDLSAPKLREAVESVSSSLPSVLNPLLLRSRRAFREGVDESLIWPQEDTGQDATGIQWMHRIYLIDSRRWSDPSRPLKDCRQLVPKSRPEGITDCSLTDGLLILPSIGSSLAVCTEGQCDRAFQALKRVVALQNAYWAGAFDIDSELFYELHGMGQHTPPHDGDIHDLERRYIKILEVHEQNTLFRSSLVHHVCHMSPQATLIWQELADAWQLDTLLTSVEEKLEALEELSGRITQNVSRKQDKKLSVLVLLFTLLSSATVAIEVIRFLQGPVTTSLDKVALGIFVGIVVVLVLMAWRLLEWTGGKDVLTRTKNQTEFRPLGEVRPPGLGLDSS